MSHATLLCGDALAVLATIPDASVRCCVTSPPYWGLRNYGADGQIGLEPSPEEYVAKLVAVFREVRRVLTEDGTLWINVGDSYASDKASEGQGKNGQRANPTFTAETMPKMADGLKAKDLVGIPWMVAFALRADGWYLWRDIIWAKPNPMPESVRDRPTSSHEYLFLLTKSASYYYDATAIAEPIAESQVGRVREDVVGGTSHQERGQHSKGGTYKQDGHGRRHAGFNQRWSESSVPPPMTRNARSVWTIATQPYAGAHFATFPEELPRRCIAAGTSDKGGCAQCGKPMVRQTMTEREYDHTTTAPGKSKEGPYAAQTGDGAGTHAVPDVVRARTVTTDWQPSCECATGFVPDTVLDPFGGSGTTAAIALGMGRSAIHVDLNPAYIELARQRIGPLLCVDKL